MKNIIKIFIIMIVAILLTACSTDKKGAEGSTNKDNNQSKQTETVYGIGEPAKIDGLEITIDKIDANVPKNTLFKEPEEGQKYIQIYYTFKNTSNEEIASPKKTSIYIVYKENSELTNKYEMKSDISSIGIYEGNYDTKYSEKKLQPGESVSGWMIYTCPIEMKDIKMHYYKKYVNTDPSLIFKFSIA